VDKASEQRFVRRLQRGMAADADADYLLTFVRPAPSAFDFVQALSRVITA
jgi:hypothetical protein